MSQLPAIQNDLEIEDFVEIPNLQSQKQSLLEKFLENNYDENGNIMDYVPFLERSGELFKPSTDISLVIIGCGAVGSPFAFYAGKHGFSKFKLFDFDTIGSENVNNQLYFADQIGELKTLGLSEFIRRTNPSCYIETHGRFDESSLDSIDSNTIVVLAVDSMEVRRSILEMLKLKSCLLIVDMRLTLTSGDVLVAEPNMISELIADSQHSNVEPRLSACGSPIAPVEVPNIAAHLLLSAIRAKLTADYEDDKLHKFKYLYISFAINFQIFKGQLISQKTLKFVQ